MKTKIKSLWLMPLLLIATDVALAGGVRMYGAGEVPQAGEIAAILSGGNTTTKPKMRGIRLDSAVQPETKTAGPAEGAQATAQANETVVGLPIEFAFNSSEILPANQAQLDAVAEGIKMTSGIRVVVEGHTDAHGSASYNNRLSRQRAEAVKQYLISKHGINAAMLVVEGLGASAPINAADPFAAENRRVQLRAAN